MRDVNWWLMALAFLLGLVLTLALTIRKVTREVPVSHTLAAKVSNPAVRAPEVKAPDVRKVAGAAAAAVATGAVAKKVVEKVEKAEKVVHDKIDDVLERDPYGAGSIRVTARSAAPAGYTIKGDKDTGRYFTLDSPDYEAIEAEVWFANEASAEKAGFLRWDAEAGTHPVDPGADAAKAIITGGTTTPESAAVVISGGTTIPAGTSAIVLEGSAISGSAAMIVSAAEVAEVELPAGPHGPGSARAGVDGSGPAGWSIKGNADSMLYHGTDSPAYEETVAEVWFIDEATAKAAGFDKWDKNFK
jgi:hypothetical protein